MATLLRRPLADVAACLFPGHGGPPLISAFTSASTRYGAAISRTAIPAKSDLAVETLDSSRGLQDWTILGSVRHPERSTLDEDKKIRIDDLGMTRKYALREALVNFELPIHELDP